MKAPIVKHVSLSPPAPFALHGSAIQIGGQLAEQLLREPLFKVLDAMPEEKHEDLLAGVLSEVCAVVTKTIGKRRTAAALRNLADIADRITPEQASAAGLPTDPEVH